MNATPPTQIVPLTPDRWDDFASLCRQMGSNRGCWCMWWREEPGAARQMTRRNEARQLVDSDRPPGLIAYRDGVAVGWVAVAPREDYRRLNKGRDTAPIDERPNVWAVPCFFVAPPARQSGVSAALLDAAMAFAAAHGADLVEGVPGDPTTRTRTAGANYTGIVSTFEAAGFQVVARRTPKGRVVMRRQIGGAKR